ncbi:WecB/TagA/CpsF family glycosyltransferase [Candidatus Peregrinibacteria bacterium]|nr:WecB/TagA/CpsF family glycosyltransferase [Candidatus Peregrinibacteria bacterium]
MKKKVDIAGIKFNAVRYEDVLTAMEVFIKGNEKHMIVTPNPEMIVYSQKDEAFKKVLNSATLAVPDGIGILWAAHYLNLPKAENRFIGILKVIGSLFQVLFKMKAIYKVLPARVTGTDLLFRIVNESQKNGWRIYLLGAAPGIAGIAIERLSKKYPKAIFAGSFAGTPAETHEDELCERINLAEPDILFVAYGHPNQEEWIHRNLHKLTTTKVAIGVGGAIDFAAGKAKRAPQIFRSFGLEWFWRLITQPRRIKRIWNATFVFVSLIFRLKRSKNS